MLTCTIRKTCALCVYQKFTPYNKYWQKHLLFSISTYLCSTKFSQDVFSSLRNAKWLVQMNSALCTRPGHVQYTIKDTGSTQLFVLAGCWLKTPFKVRITCSTKNCTWFCILVQKSARQFTISIQPGSVLALYPGTRFYCWHFTIVLCHKFISTYYMFLAGLMTYNANDM